MIASVPFSDLPPMLERLFAAYTERAQSAENRFLSSAAGTAFRNFNHFVLQRSRCSHAVEIPFIPENAPFTAEQRAWLNGLLAGYFLPQHSAGMLGQVVASHRGALCLAIRHRRRVGAKLAKELKAQGHLPAVSTLVGYTPAAWRQKLCTVSPAPTAMATRPTACNPSTNSSAWSTSHAWKSSLMPSSPSVISHYEHFCKFGATRREARCPWANRLCSRVDCDVDVDEPFERWKAALMPRLSEGRAKG